MAEAGSFSAPQIDVGRKTDPPLAAALSLALLFASVSLGIQIASNLWQAHIGYGYFRDEMYYIICGRHLAWGYVDHGPLVAIQARLALALFGRSLAGIRMLSATAGAASVFLTGILAWALGGRRPAQALAMLCVLIAPISINFLDTGLPFAISAHNNYYLWGPHGATGEVMIVIAGLTLEEMSERYASVQIAGRMGTSYSMPYEHRNIYLARNRKGNLLDDWPKLKAYI